MFVAADPVIDEVALGELGSLMWTAVLDGEDLVTHIEDRDVEALHVVRTRLSGRHIGQGAHANEIWLAHGVSNSVAAVLGTALGHGVH